MAVNRRKPNHKPGSRPGNSHPGAKPVKPAKRRDDRRKKPVEKPEEQKGDQPAIGTIQWFPGHMARTRRKIQESLKMVDAVVEIVDARIPLSSRNPEMDYLTDGKPRMVILNKADLADENANRRWLAYFKKQGMAAIAVDCKSGRGCNQFDPAIRELLSDLLEKWESKGANRTIRAMIVGIPNVGKSSFINRMNKGGKAKVEDRPGVTRQNQWFVIEGGTQLLDTPGVLWPKFEDQTVAMRLAFTGAIKDQVLDMEEMACELLGILRREYPQVLLERYKLEEPLNEDNYELLHDIGRKRGMLVSGGQIDTGRASIMLMDEYRGGKLGRITLDSLPSREVTGDA
ncbi:MAG: ribosome biogenesis GTPase YlqF [Ruminococcaceae bacterium]|nr:ribosome biogenesis GTPase YlqF [Oscillospiraceae bacterium]